MKLIIGLGNPDQKYQNTRHNLGQSILTKYVQNHYHESFKKNNFLSAQVLEIGQGSDKKIFAIPLDYMNSSGIAVQKLSQYYKISPANIYIIHDDLDLEVGDYKVQFDRGPAGHNGIKSIIEYLGTQQFNRIRVGTGKPQDQTPVENYVLQTLPQDQQAIIDNLLPEIFKEIDNIINI
jgi:PTH1 family peptidyl-tRNA hydrolase